MFLYLSNDAKKLYYAYTSCFRKYRNKIDWLFIVKIKPRSRFHVVHNSNDEVTRAEDVFQLDEWVDLYWVPASTELEEDLIFHVIEKSNIHVDINELKDILNTSKNTRDDEDEGIKQLQFKLNNGYE